VSPECVPHWANWWQDDLPCAFTREDAARSAAYLEEVLGAEFLSASRHPASQVNHPILQRWKGGGANAFLELNALASDLRVVSGAQGFASVMRDLKDRRKCSPTWHTLHAAALHARAQGATIERFYPQTDESCPDFLISYDGGQCVAFEAKLLTKSGPEVEFEARAAQVSEQIMTGVLGAATVHPVVTVVFRDAENLPSAESVVAAAAGGLARFERDALEFRSPLANIFIDPADGTSTGVSESRTCLVLCPKSHKEDSRVHRIAAKASRQLLSDASKDHPGMLVLGITHLQDPGYVAGLFQRRFAAGHYPGISTVLLMRTGTNLDPPARFPIDLLAAVHNSRAARSQPKVPLRPVGSLARLPLGEQGGVPAYRRLTHEVRVGDGPCSLSLPDIRVLSPDMLAEARCRPS
jgi:hypothetical protein